MDMGYLVRLTFDATCLERVTLTCRMVLEAVNAIICRC